MPFLFVINLVVYFFFMFWESLCKFNPIKSVRLGLNDAFHWVHFDFCCTDRWPPSSEVHKYSIHPWSLPLILSRITGVLELIPVVTGRETGYTVDRSKYSIMTVTLLPNMSHTHCHSANTSSWCLKKKTLTSHQPAIHRSFFLSLTLCLSILLSVFLLRRVKWKLGLEYIWKTDRPPGKGCMSAECRGDAAHTVKSYGRSSSGH